MEAALEIARIPPICCVCCVSCTKATQVFWVVKKGGGEKQNSCALPRKWKYPQKEKETHRPKPPIFEFHVPFRGTKAPFGRLPPWITKNLGSVPWLSPVFANKSPHAWEDNMEKHHAKENMGKLKSYLQFPKDQKSESMKWECLSWGPRMQEESWTKPPAILSKTTKGRSMEFGNILPPGKLTWHCKNPHFQ